jgi:hypothetical protein
LEEVRGVQEGNARLNIQYFLVAEGGKLLRKFISKDVVTMVIYLLGRGHLLDLLNVLQLNRSLLLSLPFGFLI